MVLPQLDYFRLAVIISLMKKYILKEYGSWGVMILSFLTGLLAGGVPSMKTLAAFFSLALFINAKQALTLWLRSQARNSLIIFLAETGIASVLMLMVLGADIIRFLPLVILPAAYLLLLRFSGEHAIETEVVGFLLLTLSALVARYASVGNIDLRLYSAVAVFFTAGVFKVRIQFRKGMRERISMFIYAFSAALLYLVINIPLLPLLPLMDNLLFAVALYRVRLRTAGWLEVAKGVLFLILMTICYQPFPG